MKYLIVASKIDPASRNIVMNLMDLGRFEYHIIDGEMTKTENLDLAKIKNYDMVIFASRHSAQKKEKTLCVHSPGNFKEVWGGGEPGRLCPASALFQKKLFENLNIFAEESKLKYKVTMEATHHGPLIDTPCVFIEIGSGPEEWRDKRASFVVAKTIRETIENFKPNPYREIAVGIGGPHYCASFNKIQARSNVAIAHVIPKYIQPIEEKMILEAVNQTIEEIDFVLVDWKGLGKAQDRDKVIEILEKNYLPWKKTGDIPK
jgi:D-aminoacyl-tRNA deacylase